MKLHTLVLSLVAIQLIACGEAQSEINPNQPAELIAETEKPPTFEEFRLNTYREPGEDGVYIVNGDTPIADDQELYAFYQSFYGSPGALTINTVKGVADKYDDTRKLNLTYCVSDGFGANKAKVIQALRDASDNGWEKRGNVNFTYVPAEDKNCTNTNSNIWFDVRPVATGKYSARAFFPGSSRASRNVLIDDIAFASGMTPLADVLGHELGHALGFRHEHARQEAGRCAELGFNSEYNFLNMTDYDSASIMHYPQCGGTGALKFTNKDADGVARVYGPPAGGTAPAAYVGKAWGNKTFSATGTVYADPTKIVLVKTITGIAVGTQITVSMQGTGNADLYVSFGTTPSLTKYNCRPYLDTSNEICSMTVSSVENYESVAHIWVVARQTSTGSVTATWTEGFGWSDFTASRNFIADSANVQWTKANNGASSLQALVSGTPFAVHGVPEGALGVVEFGPGTAIQSTCPGGPNSSYRCNFVVPPGKTTAKVGLKTAKAISNESLGLTYFTELPPKCSVSISPTTGSLSANTEFTVDLNLETPSCVWSSLNFNTSPSTKTDWGSITCKSQQKVPASKFGVAGQHKIRLEDPKSLVPASCISNAIQISQ